jgi:hypothetical protein
MGVPKRMAVVVSGLVFAGGAALAVGAASPASAQALTAAPQVSMGCGGGCGGRNHHHFRQWHSNNFRHHQRVIVINRNHNFGRSESGQAQREHQNARQFSMQPMQRHIFIERQREERVPRGGGEAAGAATGGAAGGGGDS